MSLNDSVSDSGPSLSDIEHVGTLGSGNTAAGFNGHPSELDSFGPADPILRMPPELWERLFGSGWLGPKELQGLAGTCATLRHVCHGVRAFEQRARDGLNEVPGKLFETESAEAILSWPRLGFTAEWGEHMIAVLPAPNCRFRVFGRDAPMLRSLCHVVYRGSGGSSTAICEALRDTTTLTSLDLYLNQLGEGGGAAIGAALRDNTTLTSLDLSYN